MNELIDAIRCYLNCQCCEHDLCDYILEDGYCNIDKILRDAADAIERLQAENNALRSENETYHKLVLLSTGEINELRYKLHLDEMDIEEIKLP